MPRQAREESATGYYHIMMRGINREYIYSSDDNKKLFLQLIREETSLDLAAFCLMDNHVHLVLKAELDDLSPAMKRLNVKYAMHYNKQRRRVGHVFQNRYKSEVIDTDAYLLQVIRYVHNNPVKAKVVNKVDVYSWSSYLEYFSDVTIISKEQKEFVLAVFSGNLGSFGKFHLENDDHEYLDTKEDIARNRLELAQKIITNYCEQMGITDGQQIRDNDQYLRELVTVLLEKSKLSHRKMANLLEISPNIVHRISKLRAKK